MEEQLHAKQRAVTKDDSTTPTQQYLNHFYLIKTPLSNTRRDRHHAYTHTSFNSSSLIESGKRRLGCRLTPGRLIGEAKSILSICIQREGRELLQAPAEMLYEVLTCSVHLDMLRIR